MRDRKGQHLDVFQAIRRAGLIRARVDGELIEVTDQPPKLAKAKSHTIEAVVDRISIREGIRPRLAESLDLALKLSDGGVVTLTESPEGWDEQFLSIHLNCPGCGAGLPAIEPRSFSFNSPHGACPACQGLGSRWSFQPELACPIGPLVGPGAVAPWRLVDAVKTHALRCAGHRFATHRCDSLWNLARRSDRSGRESRPVLSGARALLEQA